MARAYRMTSARRAAIRKAQLASARKRRGRRKKRIATAVGVGAGVIGVTLAAKSYRRRGRGSKNVVNATMEPSIQYSDSTDVDVVRHTISSQLTTRKTRSGRIKHGIDFGKTGSPVSVFVDIERRSPRWVRTESKLKRAARGNRGYRRIRVGKDGSIDIVKRNRQNFNAQRRNDYDSAVRSNNYENQKKKKKNKPIHLTKPYRDQKAIEKRNNALRRNIQEVMFRSGGSYDPFNLLGGK